MKFLTKLGLDKTRFTILLMVSLVVAGLLSYQDFPKREDPEITIRNADVTVTFPGLPPERMEKLIAEQVERKIRSIKEVKDIETLLVTGRVKISVSLKDNIYDLDPIWQDLRDKMDEASRDLPDGASGPFVNTDVGDVTIASIVMTAEGFSYREMEESAKEFQRQLYTVEGVGKVELYGVQEERIWLEVDAERIAAVGNQIQQLINDLQAQNIILPAGELNANGTSLLLEASGDFKSVSDVELMLTRINNSNEYARLLDLVTVKRGYVSPLETPVYYNGRPGLTIGVQMQSGYDIQGVGERVLQATNAYEATLPIGYSLNFATFQPDAVSKAVSEALSNVAQTFIVVVLVVLGFLGWRSGIVIASIVPFAVMFALLGMGVLNIALEQVSIAAVIISLGLLVDNGVVIVEDILRQIDEGVSRREAGLAAGKQFAMPLLISSFTTIFAFTPFFILDGAEGEYAFSLGAVVALTLIGSWLSSMYFMPFIASKVLKRRKIKEKDENVETPGFAKTYLKLLSPALKFAPFVVIACYGLVVISLSLFSNLKSEQFPESERTEVLIYMDMPKVSHINDTINAAERVGKWINNADLNPEVKDQVLYVGAGGPRFYLALTPADRSPSSAFFLVNAASPVAATAFTEKAKRYLFENHPEARFKVKRLSMGAGESGTVKIEITGSDLDKLLALSRETEGFFRDAPGLIQNENDWGEKIVKFVIDVDQDKARRLGITSQNMSQLLSAYFNGYQISDYREDDQSIPIMLRAAEKDRDSIEDLLNITLSGNSGVVSLEQTSGLLPILEYSQIRRKNQVRTIIVTAKSDVLTAGELYNRVKDGLDQLDLSGGYKIKIGGEIEDAADTNNKLAAGLPYALMLMFLAVVFQFNSFKRSMIVFMTVPLIFVGIPYGLLVTSEPMSFFGTLGVISLAGIVINNAIVLIDQIDIEIQSMELEEAIISAASKRLRPILLTSITTVIGLLPLYLFGGVLWVPLAVVMMFGLAVASVLTLFFVPSLYLLLCKKRKAGTAKAI
jgi:multidrug efflux pump subunit AcrB